MPDSPKQNNTLKAVDIEEDLYNESLKKARELNMTWSDYVVKLLDKFAKETCEECRLNSL